MHSMKSCGGVEVQLCPFWTLPLNGVHRLNKSRTCLDFLEKEDFFPPCRETNDGLSVLQSVTYSLHWLYYPGFFICLFGLTMFSSLNTLSHLTRLSHSPVHVGFEALQRHVDIPVRDVIAFVVAEVTSLDVTFWNRSIGIRLKAPSVNLTLQILAT
jgi:hypothetical protein